MAIKDLLNPADDGDSKALYVFLVEKLHDEYDPRSAESRQIEFNGIMNKGGVKPVHISELLFDTNIIHNRHVLCIKNPSTESKRFKAQWTLLRHEDKFRHEIASDSPMLMRMIYRITVYISVAFIKPELWLRYAEQAFMQSKPLKSLVFTAAPRDANLPDNRVLQVLPPHISFVEFSSFFSEANHPVFTDKLKMRSAFFDRYFLFRGDINDLSGVVGLTSEDSINTSNVAYKKGEAAETSLFITNKKMNFPTRILWCILAEDNDTILMS